MSHISPNSVPPYLRELTGQLNIQGGRAMEILGLLKELRGDDPRLEVLMDQHHSAMMSYIRLHQLLTNEIERSFDDE